MDLRRAKLFALRAAQRLEGDNRAFCQLLTVRFWQSLGYLDGDALTGPAAFKDACAGLAPLCPELFGGELALSLLFEGGGNSLAAQSAWELQPELLDPARGGCGENLGVLYQTFQSGRRGEVIHVLAKKAVTPAEIPVATQLFTPPWVARYLAENSLGRYWREQHPESGLRLPYLAGEPRPVGGNVSPQELRMLDPCCGSGNLLVAGFDLLLSIYADGGVPPAAAARPILEQNLAGLDIDPLMIGLTRLALLARAAVWDPGLLQQVPTLRLALADDCRGSLLASGDEALTAGAAALLAEKYHAVAANPPYLRTLDKERKAFLNRRFPLAAGDLFAAFICRDLQLCREDGYAAFMTPNVWLAIRSYGPLRRFLLTEKSLVSLVQIARGAYYDEATVDVCAFVCGNGPSTAPGFYMDLSRCRGNMDAQEQSFLNRLADGRDCHWAVAADFAALPTQVLAFWLSPRERQIFRDGTPWGELADVRQGVATADNRRFLRYWFECDPASLYLDCPDREAAAADPRRWYPYNKGGVFHRWYGNNEYVIDYRQDGAALRSFDRAVLRNPGYWFRPCISWSLVSSGRISFRWKDGGQLFDVAGMSCFGDEETLLCLLSLGNSCLIDRFMAALAPTVNYQVGNIKNIPVLPVGRQRRRIVALARENIALCRADWDAQELSWDFQLHPWLTVGAASLREAAARYRRLCAQRFERLQQNEEELNRLWLELYGLGDELSPAVAAADVCVAPGDDQRELRSLLSFAVGCLLGRYHIPAWQQPPRRCLVLGDELTDAVTEWLAAAFGPAALGDGLAFIGETLGGGDGRAALRRYFDRDFYGEHCRRYHRRPVYWLFDSGPRHEFRALVSLHSWQADTLETVYRCLEVRPHDSAELRAYAQALAQAAAAAPPLDLDDGVLANFAIVQALAQPPLLRQAVRKG